MSLDVTVIESDTFEGLMVDVVNFYFTRGARTIAKQPLRAPNCPEYGKDESTLHLYSLTQEAHIPVTHKYGVYSVTLSHTAWRNRK